MPQLKRIYFALSILQLVPIWSVRYLPTVDGASHVYNAWILRELLMHRGGLLQLGPGMTGKFRVRALSRTGEPRGERTYDLWPIGYATNGSLRDDFPLLHDEPATFVIEPAQQTGTDLRAWAMITTTDYVAGRATISLPSNE
jgi:hypothetical protein